MSTSASSTSSLSPSSVPSGAPQQASISASATRWSSSVRIGRMSMVVSSEMRHCQCIDVVIFRVSADEFHERDLPAEIESGHQAIISPRNLEPDPIAVQHLGLRGGLPYLVGRGPLSRSHERMPALERCPRFRMLAPEFDKDTSSNDSHKTL